MPGKRRLSKTDPLFETLGTFDQLSAAIGLAIALSSNPKNSDVLTHLQSVQSDLLGLGASLAAEKPDSAPILAKLDQKIAAFERAIDQWEQETGALQNFILAGGAPTGAALHLARTIARQAERSYHRSSSKNEAISRYLNRISDFLFQAARVTNFRMGRPEQIWKSSQNTDNKS